MMRQVVNLYTDEFKPKIVICSFKHGLVALFIALLCFLIQLYLLQSSYNKVNSEYLELTDNIDLSSLEKDTNISDRIQSEMLSKKLNLEDQITSLERQVYIKKTLGSIVKNEITNNIDSFYEAFLVIAKQSENTISISEIAMYQDGQEMLVNGLSLSKGAIPDYLNKVKAQRVFANSNYGLLKIEKKGSESFYRFTMTRKNGQAESLLTDMLPLEKNGG